jgi:DNA-binding XRE family transcriptional regulator
MKKTRGELELLGQGKRLLEFMVMKKIKNRSELARIVGVSSSSINQVIWNNKEIRQDLAFKIAGAFPDLDVRWLLTGVKSELSTSPPDILQVEKVEENAEKYITLQKLLDEKERYILSLEDRVASQKKAILNLTSELEACKRREQQLIKVRSG